MRTRVLIALLLGLAIPALMAWRELKQHSELSVALGLTPARAAEFLHADQRAWLVILVSGLVATGCALVVASWARTPLLVLVAALGITILVVVAAVPIYWFTYRGALEGLHINISPSRRYSASFEVLVSLVSYWLSAYVPRRSSAHAAA